MNQTLRPPLSSRRKTSAVEVDYLVLGSGVAGLISALGLSSQGKVLILTKKSALETASRRAQGGIASVHDPSDSFETHIQDTLSAGAGLCHPERVRLMVEKAPASVQKLIDWGVQFSKSHDSNDFHLTREGGHSNRRIFHSEDHTGLNIHSRLLELAKRNPNIQILENQIGIDLLTEDKIEGGKKSPHGKCLGCYALNTKTGEVTTIKSKATILATGGAGKVYLYTTNPDTASGDGIAMAHRAGARVANLEFMQFHPTCLYHPNAKSFLITEALRGEGGILVNQKGRPFMGKYHSLKELAPRDIVARAIDHEMKRSGDDCVYLDISHKSPEFIQEHFPSILETCRQFGINILKDPIPVVPAAHYMCGGVITDSWGQSTIPNLFAVGEVAHTGVHGANRLASNSLLECCVFANRAAEFICENKAQFSALDRHSIPNWEFGRAVEPDERVNIAHNWEEIRRLMWNYVGIVRSDRRLKRASDRLQMLSKEIKAFYWGYEPEEDIVELRNLARVASLIVQSAQWRKESRGLHYTVDYPDSDDTFYLRDTIL